jgi:phosphoribosyl 1,2-cyclic phosphodiesterase
MAFKCTFYGNRGSLPVPDQQTIKYGGNTTCIVLECGEETIILDAGSGLRNFSGDFSQSGRDHATFLFTHYHWDHIQGFPFFAPLSNPKYRFSLYGDGKLDRAFGDLLRGQVMHPYFPLSLDEFGAEISINQIRAGQEFRVGDAIVIKTAPLNHPGRCLAYRVEYDGKAFVLCTDTEHFSCFDRRVLDIAASADVLVYDATYTEAEYTGEQGPPRTGWGHSTNIQAARVAHEAGVKHLFLSHHATDHSDDFLEQMLEESREVFTNVFLAHERMELML